MTLLSAIRAAIEASAGTAINGLVAGLFIAALTAFLLRFLGHRNPGTRFAISFASLVAVAMMPFIYLIVRIASSTVEHAQASSGVLTLPGAWAFALFTVWITVSALACLRLAVGLWKLKQLWSCCKEFDLSAHPLLDETVRQHCSGRRVVVCVSNNVATPTAIGFFKPTVILPTWAVAEMSDEELNVILLHELAHLSRRDDWTNLVQKIVQALFFFHPAIWWIEKHLTLEREMACDEAVVAGKGDARVYARCLLSLAERGFGRRGIILAQAAVNRLHELSARVELLLSTNRAATNKIWKPAVAGAGLLSCVGLFLLAGAPQIISFQGEIGPAQATVNDSGMTPGLRTTAPLQRVIYEPPRSSVQESVPAKAMPKKLEVSTSRVSRTYTEPRHSASSLVLQAKFYEPGTGSSGRRIQRVQKPDDTSRELLFVMESTQYDEFGSLTLWKVRVVKLTVFHPQPSQLSKQSPTKSI